jgi:hypothetical protein
MCFNKKKLTFLMYSKNKYTSTVIIFFLFEGKLIILLFLKSKKTLIPLTIL